MVTYSFHLYCPQFTSFHSVFHSFHGLMNSINWPASSVWVFIAQLGEHCSANAEAAGSNPVEAPKIFFSGYFRNCLNCDSLRWSHTPFKCISIFTDNGTLVDVINRQTSKEPKVMTLIPHLVLNCLTHNILFRACHIPGFLNVQANHLSRFQVEEFLAPRPDTDIAPTQIPKSLLLQNWSLI